MRIPGRLRSKWTEADVVVELCYHLRVAGFKYRCEIPLPSMRHRSQKMRTDVVVLLPDDHILCVIEAKDTRPSKINAEGRQQAAYRDLHAAHGIKTFWCRGMGEIAETIVKVRNELIDRTPVEA